jgi:hypothetical protein
MALASHNARRREAQNKNTLPLAVPNTHVATADVAASLPRSELNTPPPASETLSQHFQLGWPPLEPFVEGGVLDIMEWLNAQDIAASASALDAVMRPVLGASIQGHPVRADVNFALRNAISTAAQAAALHGYTLRMTLLNANLPGNLPADSLLEELDRLPPGIRPIVE